MGLKSDVHEIRIRSKVVIVDILTRFLVEQKVATGDNYVQHVDKPIL